MSARQAALLTPPKSSHPTQFLSRQHFVRVSPLAATLMDLPASVANKRLTAELNPLDATLTKNRGVGGVIVNQLPPRLAVPTSGRDDVQTWRRSDLPTFRRPCLFLPDVFYLSRFHGQRQQRSKPTRGATERLPGAHSAQHRPQNDRVELSLARALQRFSRLGDVAAYAHPSRLARHTTSVFVRVLSGTLRRSHHISRLAHGLSRVDRRAASRVRQLSPAAANRRAGNGLPQAEPSLPLGHRRLAPRSDHRVPGR